jgi:hypothetical protein
MTRRGWRDGAHDTRIRAVARVDVASGERSRLRDEHESAKGTSGELQADVLLRAADDEVGARERWLHWVEEGDYYRAGCSSRATGPSSDTGRAFERPS